MKSEDELRFRGKLTTGNAKMTQMLLDEPQRGNAGMETSLSTNSPQDGPEKPELPDRLPPAFRFSREQTLTALVLGLTFWFCCLRPVWHSDVWGHLSYGDWIRTEKQIPTTEPLMPLAKGMPWVDIAWLSQVVASGLFQLWGVVGIQFSFAVAITLCAGLFMLTLQRKTGNLNWGILGAALFGLLNFQQFFVDFPAMYALWRPQLAGLVCCVLLFSRLCSNRSPSDRLRSIDWVLIPGLFVLWANLHGSFLVGLGFLALWTLGRVCDVGFRTGSLPKAIRDPQAIRTLLLLEISAVASLINPYGLNLYFEVLNFTGSPNLQDLLDWEPLTIHRSQGQWFAAMVIALAVIYRLTPRRINSGEVLLLVGLGLWTMWTSRIIVWWSIPAAYYFTLHAAAAWNRNHSKSKPAAVPLPRKGLWTVATLGICWIFFAISPFGVRVMHGRQVEFKQSVSRSTPVDAVKFLQEEKLEGLIYNAYEWGDYLRWAAGPRTQIFLNSHAHLVPVEVWRSYRTIAAGSNNSLDLLDRYGAEVVFVDLARHRELISTLKKTDDWREVYRDGIAVIFKRTTPL